MKNKNSKESSFAIYGGTYLNKGGAAIAYGTLKVLKELDIDFRYIIDPDPFFPTEFFTLFNLTPIYRYSNTLSKKTLSSVTPINTFYPFIKCLINSHTSQIRQLYDKPLWHIGDHPFSDEHSRLSVIGQIIALKSLKNVIKGKIIIGGVSIEYPRTKIGEISLRHFFKSVDYFFVRGLETYNTLSKLGVPHDKISMICDFAFHLDKKISSKLINKYSKIIKESNKPPIALIFREYSYGQQRENYIRSVKRLISKLESDYSIFFIPTSYSFFLPENDLIFLKNTLSIEDRQIINIKNCVPEETVNIFSNFEAIISARMHGAVYSALANVPTVHLYGGNKSLEVIKDTFGDTIPLIKLSDFAKGNMSNKITEILRDLFQRKDEISYEMKSRIKSVRESSIDELKYSLEERRLLE